MAEGKILLIEDEADIAELLHYNLKGEGFAVVVASSGEAGLRMVKEHHPSLIVLDLGLPGMQGLEVCRRLKRDPDSFGIPVVMLTAKSEESDIIVGLELGADDYVTKPFRVNELIARVRAVLRRFAQGQQTRLSGRIEVGPLVIDSAKHEVLVKGSSVEFTLAEFRLLKALAENAGRVLTRDQLVEKITDSAAFILDRNVDVHVRSVRKKLGEENRRLIVTVRGVGYKFKA